MQQPLFLWALVGSKVAGFVQWHKIVPTQDIKARESPGTEFD